MFPTVDDIPSNAPSGAPAIILDLKRRLTGVDASKLRWRVWHLMNEAATCYDNCEYDGSLSCLESALEAWLETEFESSNMKPSSTFKLANEVARAKGIITNDEFDFFEGLREFRNTLVHSKDEKWMVPDSMKELTNQETPASAHHLNSQGSKDLTTLVISSEMSWKFLEKTIEMMRRRYPSQTNYLYVIGRVIRHGDLIFTGKSAGNLKS